MVQLIQIKKYLLTGFTQDLSMNSVLRSFYKTIIATASYSFLKLLKMSTMLGSRLNYFSIAHTATPVLAAHISTPELLGVTCLRTLFHVAAYPALGVFGLFYHVPSLLGAYYFKTMLNNSSYSARLACAAAPMVCMALFISTPVGSVAWVYSLYWLIPAAIALLPRNNIFLTALASTFMTHAAGSVLFILTTPMVPAFWFGLLPIVALERCMFAAGITGLYYVVKLTQQAYKVASARFSFA
jgi:hypothetical protein